MDEAEHGRWGSLLHLPLPKGAGGPEFLAALRQRALPFLLAPDAAAAAAAPWPGPPDLLLVCAGCVADPPPPICTRRPAPPPP